MTQGVDKTYGQVKDTMFSSSNPTLRRIGRKRLPRPFKGASALTPTCHSCPPLTRHPPLALHLHLPSTLRQPPTLPLTVLTPPNLACLAGDCVLMPFSLHAALGQALMHAASYPPATSSMLVSGLTRATLGRLAGLGPGGSGLRATANRPLAADMYEEHFVLQGSRVLILTNKRVAIVNAPGEAWAPGGEKLSAPACTMPFSLQRRPCLIVFHCWAPLEL